MKSGLAAASEAWPRFPQEPLQPADSVTDAARVGVPHHEAEVVPAQRVTDGRRRSVHVDNLLRRKYFANSHGAQAVLVLQPALAFIFIDDDDLLGNRVDVLK